MHAQTEGHAEPAVGLFNIFGGHAGGSFLTGMLAGLVKGDGFGGSIKDGMLSMMTGHIADVLAPRLGVDAQTASRIAAAITPFISQFAHDRLSSHPSNAR